MRNMMSCGKSERISSALEVIEPMVASASAALCDLGFACCEEDICEAGIDCLRQAKELILRFYEYQTVEVAEVLIKLADGYRQGAQDKAAKKLLEEALAIYRGLDDSGGIAMTLFEIGYLHEEQNEVELAMQYYHQVLHYEITPQLRDSTMYSIAQCRIFE